jgi:ABC-2 type transport system ATP-binding protein
VSAALEINNLVVRYGTNEAVSGLSLDCEGGAVTAIVGPNGAGKTTTVETCEGYRRPHSGTVSVLGLDPVKQATQLHPRIGVMLQSGGVPSGAKAAETLAHFAKFYSKPQDPQQLLGLLGLNSVNAPYRRMSGGEQQRLKFAIALVGRPELVFLDEPTAGLDAHAKRIVWDVVNQLRMNGVTVVLTTHLMDDVEQLADKVAVVNHGSVVAVGSPSELTASAQPVLQFRATPGIDLAELRLELPPNSTITEAPAGHYQLVGVQDSAALNLVSTWSTSRSVEVHDISTGRRKLEDVFLELTGDGSDRG